MDARQKLVPDDELSVVTNSTHESDLTRPASPTGLTNFTGSVCSGCESPIIPLQAKLQAESDVGSLHSEASQSLLPATAITQQGPQQQEQGEQSDGEESQSLLPQGNMLSNRAEGGEVVQTDMRHGQCEPLAHSYRAIDECKKKSNRINQQSKDKLRLEDSENEVPVKGLVLKGFSSLNGNKASTEQRKQKKRSDNSYSTDHKNDYTGKTFSSSGKSHRDSQSSHGASQHEPCTSNDRIDSLDRLQARLDRLVNTLDKAPRRQMLVMEAAVVQCISSLQTSLHNKLQRPGYSRDSMGNVKKLLQTTQTSLTRLTELHRSEKVLLNQSMSQSSHPQTQSSHQKTQSSMTSINNLGSGALEDLGRRQAKVFGLLKRQKLLVELLKSGARINKKLQNRTRIISDDMANNRTTGTNNITGEKSCISKSTMSKIETNGTNASALNSKEDSEKAQPSDVYGVKDGDVDSREGKYENMIDKEQEEELTAVPNTQDFSTQNTARTSDRDLFSQTDYTGLDKNWTLNNQDSKYMVNISKQTEINKNNITQSSSVRNEASYSSQMAIQEIAQPSLEAGDRDLARPKRRKDTLSLDTCWNTSDSKGMKRAFKSDKKLMDAKKQKNVSSENSGNAEPQRRSDMLWLNLLRDSSKTSIKEQKSKLKGVGKCNAVPANEIQDKKQFTATKLENERQVINEKVDEREVTATHVVADNINLEKDDKENSPHSQTEEKYVEGTNCENNDVLTSARSKKANNYNIADTFRKPAIMTSPLELNNIQTNKNNNNSRLEIGSPPNMRLPGELWHNVSPTCTSMSSDVFVVKASELEKCMRRRSELPVQGPEQERFEKSLQQSVLLKASGNYCRKDTISLAIDSVIQKSREFADNVYSQEEMSNSEAKISVQARQPNEPVTAKPTSNWLTEQQAKSVSVVSSIQTKTSGEALQKMPNTSSQVRGVAKMKSFVPHNQTKQFAVPMIQTGSQTLLSQIAVCQPHEIDQAVLSGERHVPDVDLRPLPTLKGMVKAGSLTPGKNALSFHTQGKRFLASLTSQGKIKTLDGLIFTTASQWMSTLSDGVKVKKRKAYQMILYKGKPLLQYCFPARVVVPTPGVTAPSSPVSSQAVSSKGTHNQHTYVDAKDLKHQAPHSVTEEEKYLNQLLSTSLVRLLTEADFVTSSDLPDNFWTEDYSKVKLSKKVWDSVDDWD
ncbi:histone-lysine N-methyltransferase, H3 lysine-79 specific-like [Mya arenaria]|uniref:histone-lysine N-methyltransferase, H3 lysine-79 specific-like n=1 Tax=Mya arenaria TaxID=6604 RepID=UPI0022E148E1|nr:histone-lysine N-methyltransferase, H3 lysine-79 specific-like [Mya arenaria]